MLKRLLTLLAAVMCLSVVSGCKYCDKYFKRGGEAKPESKEKETTPKKAP